MKTTKKLFIAALTVAGFTFAGCNMNQDDLNMIDFDAPGNRAEINYTNETGAIQRGWKTFNTGHETATCVISLDYEKGNAGNMGFIWGLEDNKDDTCNFYVASLNYGNTSNGNSYGIYISYYKNVGKKYLTGEASVANFCDKDGNQITTTENANGAVEKQIIPTSTSGKNWLTLQNNIYKNNKKVVFQLTWKKGSGYKVECGYDINEDGNLTASTDDTGYFFYGSDDDKAKDKAPDLDMGAYAMSNPGTTLSGTWEFPKKKLVGSFNTIAE